MKFEHRILINDPNNTTLPVFSRQQLWNGLVLRAESPQLFLPNLDGCLIIARELNGLSRALQFGDLKIHDHVHFDFLNFVHYRVPHQNDIPESSLRMTIEEPAPLFLSVRFDYESVRMATEELENAVYEKYRCAAYVESDAETIQVLRTMLKRGSLN